MDIIELADIVNQHGKSIYGFCQKLAQNQVDTEDLYQETFLKAMELCHKIDSDKNPKGFLIAIAVGLWKNNRYKYARRQRIAPVEELNENWSTQNRFMNTSTPEDIAITNELRATIQNAIERLNRKMRIPLYMYYTAEMSVEEISMALKIPKGTVKSRLFKARKILKNIIELEASKHEYF